MTTHLTKAKLATLALLALAALDAAQASTFQIDFSGTKYNYTFGAPVPPVFTASITVITEDDPLTTFDNIVGISGTINNEAITGLVAGGTYDPVTINQFSSSAPYVNNGGLSFTSATTSWNLRNWGNAEDTFAISNRALGWYVYVGPGNGSVSVTAAVSAVPEPGTGALFMAGLGVAGLTARRRKH